MSIKIKNYLGIAAILGIIAIGYASVSLVRSIEPTSFRSFTVSAEGKISAAPDIASISFGVVTEGGTDIAILQEENTKKANEAIDFLKASGIKPEDIKTSNYSVEPRYQYSNCVGDRGPCPPPEIVGYAVRQTVSIKIRDFSKIGAILSGVVSKGANVVSGLSFEIDDPIALQNQARAQAIEKARSKAKATAKAGDFRLGKLLSVEESGGYIPFYRDVKAEALSIGVGGATPAPTIEPGSQEITVNVFLKYEIK